jgi:ribosomal protein L33
LRLDLEGNRLDIMKIWKITLECQDCGIAQSIKGKKKNETLTTEKNYCTLCKLHGNWIISKVVYIEYKFSRIPMGVQYSTD